MSKDTSIQWCHHTFNPWRGCTKVSAGCKFCYAAQNIGVKMNGIRWGSEGDRVVKAESGWAEPLRWDRAAAKAGEQHRVFCASLADVFEDWSGPMTDVAGDPMAVGLDGKYHPFVQANCGPVGCSILTMDDVRMRLLRAILDTPNLDWLLLTKRPENVGSMIYRLRLLCKDQDLYDRLLYPWSAGTPPKNVWLGISVEDQAAADERIPHLLKIPAVVRFLSMEPLLSHVDLDRIASSDGTWDEDLRCSALTGQSWTSPRQESPGYYPECINWVIVGGESGPNARPMHPDHARSIRDQCKTAGVPFFFKQWGDIMSVWNDDMPEDVYADIDRGVNLAGYGGPEYFRVGKKAAGRLLDGVLHDEFPTPPEVIRA